MRKRNAVLAMLAAAGAAIGIAATVQAQTSSSVWDGIYTEAQASRGSDGFTNHCAVCHGASLSGTGEAPGLQGAQFVSDFGGLTVADLFDRIRTTMPQDAPGSLSRDQYADILAFLLKANGFPAGQKELDRRSEYLKAISFDAANPHPAAAPAK